MARAFNRAAEHVQILGETRLQRAGEYGWRTPYGYLLSYDELKDIRERLPRENGWSTMERLLRDVYAANNPLLYHKLKSDGYSLVIEKQSDGTRVLTIKDDFGTDNPASIYTGNAANIDQLRSRAYDVVQAVVELAITRYRVMNKAAQGHGWPTSGGRIRAGFIDGVEYHLLARTCGVPNARPRDVIGFVREAVPAIWEEWEQAGYRMVAAHMMVDTFSGSCVTELRLVAKD